MVPFIVSTIARVAVNAAMKKSASNHAIGAASQEVERAILADDRLVNELSIEKPYQSRVAVGSVISAVGVLAPLIGQLFGWDTSQWVEILTALVTLSGAALALYGRFASGLKPLFSRK
tara:strand:- start:420 stop:773 length:354 start_codon:yes stop_codon:yes gene_type:complete